MRSGRRGRLETVFGAVGHAAYRHAYYLAMYSGLLALANRVQVGWRCRPLDLGLQRLHGTRVACPQLGALIVHVHSRPGPHGCRGRGNHGLFSLRQEEPGVRRWIYRLVCATSHFGCGHVEVAFFEHAGRVTFFGIRNIASANAHRLGLRRLSTRFRLARFGEEVRVMRLVTGLVGASGFAVEHASAQECVDWCVDDRLLPRECAAGVRRSLHRRYQGLCVALTRSDRDRRHDEAS
ncbi:MAG: hypothetical protein R3F56_01195 [Planctomycetota bacterium]